MLAEHSPGWRARIGVITPTVNTIAEPEFQKMAPDGVTFHFTRMPIHRNAGALNDCGLDAITYNCTVGSMACPSHILMPYLAKAGGAEPVASAVAIVAALNALGVERMSMATPYPDAVNDHEKEYFEARGFEVAAMAGMSFPDSEIEGRAFARVSPEEIYNHAKSVDRDDAHAVFISCANFGSAGIVEALEDDLGKPVITTNTATCWASLRAAKIDDKIRGFGRLLREH